MAADNRNFVNKFANEGGGDVLVEDKRLEELKSATAKTASQISTSTDYVPLQDTDGNLVKINPASFEEAVRNVLGSLLANNDKGTTISGIPALSGSGASLDFGSVTPANLASVLGVPNFKTVVESQGESIDDIDETGWFYVYGSPNGMGYTLVHPRANNYRLQFRNTDTNSEFKVRTMNNGTWSSWERCDNFGANTPEALASLLGVYNLAYVGYSDVWPGYNAFGFRAYSAAHNANYCVELVIQMKGGGDPGIAIRSASGSDISTIAWKKL